MANGKKRATVKAKAKVKVKPNRKARNTIIEKGIVVLSSTKKK